LPSPFIRISRRNRKWLDLADSSLRRFSISSVSTIEFPSITTSAGVERPGAGTVEQRVDGVGVGHAGGSVESPTTGSGPQPHQRAAQTLVQKPHDTTKRRELLGFGARVRKRTAVLRYSWGLRIHCSVPQRPRLRRTPQPPRSVSGRGFWCDGAEEDSYSTLQLGVPDAPAVFRNLIELRSLHIANNRIQVSHSVNSSSLFSGLRKKVRQVSLWGIGVRT